MSSRVPQWAPGTPAAFCRTFDEPLDLVRLSEILRTSRQPLVLLDSARRHPVTGRFSVLGWDPWLTLSSQTLDGNPLDALREVLRRYPGPRHPDLPPVGLGWLGLFSYDLNRWIERLPTPKAPVSPVPDLLVFGMRMTAVVDHAAGRSWAASVVDPHEPSPRAPAEARRRLEAFEDMLKTAPPAARDSETGAGDEAVSAEPLMSQPQFERMVRRAQEFIAAGDIFQANVAQPFRARWPGSPWTLYGLLRQVNPSPFACFVSCPEVTVVSCSPERLVRVQDGRAQARPIAGTRPRGSTPQDDLVNGLELILSDKERAEHIMLVDLARNDLGRVCRAGSVEVNELMVLEDYSHVMHIASNVQGRLRGGTDPVDVIRAVFPGGTITGCPKVRCMELIHAMEPVARGLYTGSLGWVGFDGSLDLNILIRTMLLQEGRVSFHVGAGIVADSQPDREYAETLAKAGALFRALGSRVSAATSDAACR